MPEVRVIPFLQLQDWDLQYMPGYMSSRHVQVQQNATVHSPGQDVETAWATDLNAMGIVEEEENILPTIASEKAYVQVVHHTFTLQTSVGVLALNT